MEYKKIESLATVQQIDRVTWDAMEQYIVLEVSLGRTREQTTRAYVSLTPTAALQLLLDLGECLEGKEGEGALGQ